MEDDLVKTTNNQNSFDGESPFKIGKQPLNQETDYKKPEKASKLDLKL